MAGSASYTAILDACVLYPALIRDVLLSLAHADLYSAKWTGPGTFVRAVAAIKRMRERWERPQMDAPAMVSLLEKRGLPQTAAHLTDLVALLQARILPRAHRGKPAGVRCVQLDDANRCRIFGRPERRAFCAGLKADPEMCGTSADHAVRWLTSLESQTVPGP